MGRCAMALETKALWFLLWCGSGLVLSGCDGSSSPGSRPIGPALQEPQGLGALRPDHGVRLRLPGPSERVSETRPWDPRDSAWVAAKVREKELDAMPKPPVGCGQGASMPLAKSLPKAPSPPEERMTSCSVSLSELDWLLATQSEDGFWDADDFAYLDVDTGLGPGAYDQDLAVTSLATMAWLAENRSGAADKKARRWLRKQASSLGRFLELVDASSARQQALATLALIESTAATNHPFDRRVAKRAVLALAEASRQIPWPLDPNAWQAEHTSFVGWTLLVRHGARRANLPVGTLDASPALLWCEYWAKRWRLAESKGHPSALAALRKSSAFPVVALGLALTDEELSQDLQDTLLEAAKRVEHASSEAWLLQGEATLEDFYFLSLAAARCAPKVRNWWTRRMVLTLRPTRQREGPLEGSRDPDPRCPWSGGRVASTALTHLIWTTLYRYNRLTGAKH